MRLFFILTLIFCTSFSFAAIIESSTMENDGSWSFSGFTNTGTTFHTGCCGISPTVGSVFYHVNNFSSGFAGTMSIAFSSVLQEGSYHVTIDAGDFNNRPFSIISSIGMTSDGSLLAATSSNTATPASGTFNEWSFDYVVTSSNLSLGESLGFQITVPITGVDLNAAFDNLQVDFVAAPVPEPATVFLSFIALVFFARYRKLRL